MIVVGVDPHKRTHTAVAIERASGELRGELTVAARMVGHEELLLWARQQGEERLFALEDCRHVSGALERFLIARGERVVRVAPKLMGEANRISNRLRWHLHDIDPEIALARGRLDRADWMERLSRRLRRGEQTIRVRICREQLRRLRALAREIKEAELELAALIRAHAPELLELPGCSTLCAAKLIAEVAGVERFANHAKLASLAGVAPLDASSGRQQRHRLNRKGNRQLNLALHRIAVTQARVHPPARAFLERKRAEGKSRREALRCLKRHLVRVVWRTLRAAQSERMISISPNLQEIEMPAPALALT